MVFLRGVLEPNVVMCPIVTRFLLYLLSHCLETCSRRYAPF